MKNQEDIINDSIKLETPPEDYNLIEIHCFLALKQLTVMFYNNHISKENATIIKNKILAKYENDKNQYEFERGMFQEHIQHIKDTENARIKLRKLLNDKTEITEERLCETISVCMEIISKIFE